MKLRFPESEIKFWAERYSVPDEETELLRAKGTILRARHLTKAQLRTVVHWKSPRNIRRVDQNTDLYIEEITKLALTAKDERTRIEVLTVLDSVLWPTASVILHLFHNDDYPILDFRALWSLKFDVPKQYSFEFWKRYTAICRDIAGRNGNDMRALDRALWQYSKENQ